MNSNNNDCAPKISDHSLIKSKILIIESDEETANLLAEILINENYEIVIRTDPSNIEQIILEHEPDLILLDIMLPKINGLEICKKIRKNENFKTLPVLFVTAKDDISDKIKAFNAGADDYITKPFLVSELLARIQANLRIRKLQKELILSEERYRLLIENSPDGIILLSNNLELIYRNKKFCELLKGNIIEPITGRVLKSLFPMSDLFYEISLLIDKVKESSSLVTKEVQMNSSNSRPLHLELLGMPIKFTQKSLPQMYQVIIRDITQRKRIEEAILQTEKINALSILTAGLTHEINNPLTGISNAIQLLLKGSLSKAKQEELLKLMNNHVERIAKIVKDLKTFSQPNESSATIFSITEAIEEMINLTKYQIEKNNITLEFIKCEEKLLLMGDKYQFQQVILNILLNAIQAIEKKGNITIKVSKQDNNAVISIEDTGVGIPPHQIGRIFDPFFTTKRDWKGTGLGLAVSYRIIQLFKGTLAVQSTVGVGTCFTITVPLSANNE